MTSALVSTHKINYRRVSSGSCEHCQLTGSPALSQVKAGIRESLCCERVGHGLVSRSTACASTIPAHPGASAAAKQEPLLVFWPGNTHPRVGVLDERQGLPASAW